MICKICGNIANNKIITASEKMLGIGGEFVYVECSNCGCLQISDIPVDMSKYYPKSYYSYGGNIFEVKSGFKYFLRRKRLQHLLGKRNILGNIALKIFGNITFIEWLVNTECKPDYKILDVGCGKGHRLSELQQQGFQNLMGIDNYIDADIKLKNGVIIFKKELLELEDKHDLIMFHHTLEHVAEQEKTLKKAYNILNNNRFILIRTPVVAYSYKLYGTDWVQLDAPRHFFIHTVKSMTILSQKCGFELKKVVFDSDEFQFWGSEQYKKNISLFSEKSYGVNPEKSIFSKEQITEYANRANELNEKNEGDMACFYLYKK